MPFCGPKCSLCCSILSVWGIIQLILLGVFFYIHSYALAEDIPPVKDFTSYKELKEYYKDVDDHYEASAYNCWIAAALYAVTLGISVWQFRLNNKKNETA